MHGPWFTSSGGAGAGKVGAGPCRNPGQPVPRPDYHLAALQRSVMRRALGQGPRTLGSGLVVWFGESCFLFFNLNFLIWRIMQLDLIISKVPLLSDFTLTFPTIVQGGPRLLLTRLFRLAWYLSRAWVTPQLLTLHVRVQSSPVI